MKKYIYSVMIFMVTCLTCFSLTSCKKQEDAGKKKKIRLEFYNRKREAYAVLEKIIEKLTVTAPLSAIDEEMIEEFTALVKANPGNAELYFHVQDEDGQMYVNLMSRVVKIAVQKDIMTYLKSQPMLSYKIN